MTLTELKQAIKDSGREKVEEILETYGEEVLEAGLALSFTPDQIEEAYQGEYKSDADFAETMAEELGDVDFRKLRWPFTCIDWDQAGKELMYDYAEENGHYFRNI